MPIFMLGCLAVCVNGVMGMATLELFPTYLRSTGPGVSQNVGKGIGGLMGPPAAGARVASHGYQYALGLPLWVFLVIAILIWTLPEVAGRSPNLTEDQNYGQPYPCRFLSSPVKENAT